VLCDFALGALESMMYDVRPTDPLVLATVSVLPIGVALAATALRAARPGSIGS
jgi:hypothetical protein